jgi:hypothetical protein
MPFNEPDQLVLSKQLVDQSAHVLAAMVALGPLLINPSIWTCILTGLLIGVIREVSQEGTHISLSSFKLGFWSCVDVVFWGIGAALAWIIFA